MLNEDKIIRIYCIVDDILKSIRHVEDGRRKVTDSEITTMAMALLFILVVIYIMREVL